MDQKLLEMWFSLFLIPFINFNSSKKFINIRDKNKKTQKTDFFLGPWSSLE